MARASAASYDTSPRANSAPPATMLTVSPLANSPSTDLTPAGSRLLPLPNAVLAPSSTISLPTGCSVPAIQRLRDCRAEACATNHVQRSPSLMRFRGCMAWPEAMTIWQPAERAILAASIFVIIPPEPTPEMGFPAMASTSGVISLSSAMNVAPFWFGGAEYRPSISDSRTNTSADIIEATRAPKRSLSPKRISDVATVSFSLITGTAPCASSVESVARAFR